MALTKEIIDLVNLAMSDAVITPKEREVLVAKGLSAGCSEQEINQFIDVSLKRKLSNLGKEQLKDCPKCGGQIPLIADDCPYCGNHFEMAKAKNVVSINSEEASIIASENLRVEQEKIGAKNCPKCGAPLPFVSNVCSSCGNVLHRSADSDVSVGKLVSNIRQAVSNLENIKKISFFEIVEYRLPFVLFFISGYLLIIYGQMSSRDSSLAGSYVVMSFLLLIAAMITLFVFVLRKRKDSPVEINNNIYYEAKNNYKQYAYELNMLYGEHPEAKQLLDSMEPKIKQLEESRANNLKTTLGIFGVLVALAIGISFFTADHRPVFYQNYEDTKKASVWKVVDMAKRLPVYSNDKKLFNVPDSVTMSVVLAENNDGMPVNYDEPDSLIYRITFGNVFLESNGNKYTGEKDFDYLIRLLDEEGNRIDYKFARFWSEDTLRMRSVAKEGKGRLFAEFTSYTNIPRDSVELAFERAKSVKFLIID